MAIRFIYFDCMETLIHMDIASLEVYAEWAYQEASGLGLWEDARSFGEEWFAHRDRLLAHGDHREGTILGRIRDLLSLRAERAGLGWTAGRIEEEARGIHRGYWERYRAASYVLPEVPAALERIQREREIPFGVVSNFMVEGGIPALLSDHSLDRFFQVVLVSCENGYRKPSEFMYRAAIRAAGAAPEEILFIGDDPIADYHGSRAVGMDSLLYDRRRRHPGIERRVESFEDIERYLGSVPWPD